MKILIHISRLFVGALFLVSGLIKANDPLGFSYKLEEYFSEAVLNLPFLEAYALPFAIAICVIEILLGMAILVGFQARLTSWFLLLTILFFTFLTFYSAYFNKVTDCGCFGDAIKLTPWESFCKDLVLLVFILIIFFNNKEIKPFKSNWIDLVYLIVVLGMLYWFSSTQLMWLFPVIFTAILLGLHYIFKISISKHGLTATMVITLLLSLYFSMHCYFYLPIKDFRPYAIGKSIPEQMKLPEGAKTDVYENLMVYKNKKTGEDKEFTMNNYPWKDTANWVFVSRTTKLIEKGDEAKIHDFALIDTDGNDIAEDVLAEQNILLIVFYDVEKSSKNFAEQLNQLVKEANNKGIYVYGLSASSDEKVKEFRHEHQLAFDFLSADGTMLKTMVRSNPGVMLLKKGRVAGLWSANDLPKFEELQYTIH